MGISLKRLLLKRLDEFVRKSIYSGRSDVMRDAVKDALSEYKLSRFWRVKVNATMAVV